MEIFVWEQRMKKGFTLVKLEKYTGISKTRLNYIENGIVSPTLEELEWICEVLEVYMEDLYLSEKSQHYNITRAKKQ